MLPIYRSKKNKNKKKITVNYRQNVVAQMRKIVHKTKDKNNKKQISTADLMLLFFGPQS